MKYYKKFMLRVGSIWQSRSKSKSTNPNGAQFKLTPFLATLLLFSLCLFPLRAEERFEEAVDDSGYFINFNDVPVIEFIRYVSKVSGQNFIYDSHDLDFSVSLSTGRAVSAPRVVEALTELLKMRGLSMTLKPDYYVIQPLDAEEQELAPTPEKESVEVPTAPAQDLYDFFVYKLQYHEGPEVEDALKKVAADLRSQPDAPLKLINAIQSLQWVRATNSLLFSSDVTTLQKVNQLVSSLDVPLKQVFIEVLVIETDVKKGLEFGLQWAAGGKYKSRLGFGGGSFAPGVQSKSSFGSTMQGINATNTPSGLDQISLLPGFDLGVIGDLITHKGKSYFSLGSLVSALQMDCDSTIVLNQKIITQDNKNSTIFVGDNIPFTGSVVQTVGQSQQTTSNIEYRDIGVNLSITPRLGEGDVITLQLSEEITEALDHDMMNSNAQINGIRTTKTNMATHVHVPDKHFLVLSGMIRNTKAHQKTGLPCLGGVPFVGSAFSKTQQNNEKRNIVIFVRPHIIRSFEDYENLTRDQEEVYRSQANKEDFDAALDVLPLN